MRWSFVSKVPKFAHATSLSTAPNSMDQLVWEPCHRYTVPCQGCSARFLQSCSNVWRMTCFWWQWTHNITVHIIRPLMKCCFEINVKKDPNFCWLPVGNSSEIRVLWKQGNLSADIPSVCPGNLSVPIWLLH